MDIYASRLSGIGCFRVEAVYHRATPDEIDKLRRAFQCVIDQRISIDDAHVLREAWCGNEFFVRLSDQLLQGIENKIWYPVSACGPRVGEQRHRKVVVVELHNCEAAGLQGYSSIYFTVAAAVGIRRVLGV